MHLVSTSQPSVEPLSLDDAKLHARIDISYDDDLTTQYIVAARRYVENYCKLSLITQNWSVFYDHRDVQWYDTRSIIRLPMQPVQSITAITTYNDIDSSTVFDSSNYRLSGDNRICLNANCYWPDNVRMNDSVKIDFVAGYGNVATSVPNDIIQAIRMLVAFYYQTREATSDPMATNQNQIGGNIPYSVTSLLAPYRTLTIG